MTHTTTLTLTRQHAGFLRDAQAVHRTLLHATGGAPHLWGAPDDTHLVIRHPNPVDWAGDLGHRIHQAITTSTTTPTTKAPHTRGLYS